MVRTTPIRARRMGSNKSSDRYLVPVLVDNVFRDLALFIAYTGFTNIRRLPNGVTDRSIYPYFCSLDEVNLPSLYLLACPSLERAWRLVDQGVLAPTNELWYITHSMEFVIVVREVLTVGTLQILCCSDVDDMGTFDVLFRPDPIWMSVDAFIERWFKQHGTTEHATTRIHNAMLLLFPSLALSRDTVYNRMYKKKKEILAK
jgi:hypothetical protein